MAPPTNQVATNVLLCDGCGRPATPAHIAARIEKLQWNTRFRPIHIQTLFVAAAPSALSAERDYLALLDGLGIHDVASQVPSADAESEQDSFIARLTEFQRRGFYLAFLVECPLDAAGLLENGSSNPRPNSAELYARFGPTLVKRIQYSYKPKQIVLLSAALQPLIPMLSQAGLGQAPLLDLPRLSREEFHSAWERAQASGTVLGLPQPGQGSPARS